MRLTLCSLLFCATLVLSGTLPLVADETYYLWWATRPALGYLDHPPAVMLWAWLSENILWSPRAMNTLTWLITIGLSSLTARSLSLRNTDMFPLAFAFTPLGFALAVLLTPDAPLTLGWSLALWGWSVRGRIRSGLGGALMLWSKPSALLPLSLMLFAWIKRAPRSERSVAYRDVAIVGLVMLLLYLPHLYWSSAHGWLPWSFQVSRPWGHFALLEWVGAQLWLLSPLWATLGLTAGWRSLRYINDRSEENRARGGLAIMGIGQLLFWGGVSLGMRVEGNWSALAWPPLLMLAVDQHARPQADHDIAHPQSVLRSPFVWGALCTLPLLALPILHRMIPLYKGPPRDPQALSLAVQSCLEVTSTELSSLGSQPTAIDQLPIVAARYQEMALLWRVAYESKRPLRALYYLNAQNRRTSEFEGSVNDSAPPCDYAYLGSQDWLGDRCLGAQVSLDHDRCRITDRLPITLCLCTPDKDTDPPL